MTYEGYREVARFPSGSAAGKFYVVKEGQGDLSCDCPAWRFKKPNQERSCKHTEAVAKGVGIVSVGHPQTPPDPSARPQVEVKPQVVAGRFEPMLAEKADEPFDDPTHLWEVKFDGARFLAYVDNGRVQYIGRAGNDHTDGFPELHNLAQQVHANSLVLDGEMIVEDERHLNNFPALQSRVHRMNALAIKVAASAFPATYMAFDLLMLNGIDLTARGKGLSLENRKMVLEQLLTQSDRFKMVEHQVGNGVQFFQDCIARGLEGSMAKDRNGLYHPGKRHPAWLKVKGVQEDTFLVCGYTFGEGWRTGLFGALLLGRETSLGLAHCGSVGSGFTVQGLQEMRTILEPLETDECPFPVTPQEPKLMSYLRPAVKVDVRYHEVTPDGKLRFPVFMRVREEV